MTQNVEVGGVVGEVLAASEARVNVTYAGENGDLDATVSRDATDGDVRQWVTEALRSGAVRGIPAQPDCDLSDFVVDRHGPTEARAHALITIRPKTPFGGGRP